MAKVFVLEGRRAGQSVRLADMYTFIDGVMVEEDDDTAKMKAAVLCTMYPCKMVDHAEYVKEKSSPAPASVEPVKVEPVKVEPAKVEPAKIEPAKIESAKPVGLSAKAIPTAAS